MYPYQLWRDPWENDVYSKVLKPISYQTLDIAVERAFLFPQLWSQVWLGVAAVLTGYRGLAVAGSSAARHRFALAVL